jgi:tRNA threonylcarbamoyladenosine biosynthesis protein TsaE
MSKYITNSSQETQKLGLLLAKEIKTGAIICLSGDLGSGKTTFTQGLLKGLGAEGPYTSPTFVVLKHYKVKSKKLKVKSSSKNLKISLSPQPPLPKGEGGRRPGEGGFKNIYHIDAYRVDSKDILDLGWEEIIGNDKNIVIIEWAERIQKIIPKNSLWIKFEWKGENEREIIFKSK